MVEGQPGAGSLQTERAISRVRQANGLGLAHVARVVSGRRRLGRVFTLENFDAVGRYRDQEKGRPIDARGAFETRTGDRVKFAGVQDLATFLASSEDAQDAFIERLFHCLVKQPVRAFGPRAPAELRK